MGLEDGRALERVLALARLEGRALERAVDDVEDRAALPQADAEADREDRDAEDQPLAQLIEVLDEAESILVLDRPQGGGHAPAPLALLGDDLVRGGRRRLALRVSERRCLAGVVVARLAADGVL